MEAASLSGMIVLQKQRRRNISCSRQLVAGGHRAGLDVLGTKNPRNFTKHMQKGVPQQEDVALEVSEQAPVTANQ